MQIRRQPVGIPAFAHRRSQVKILLKPVKQVIYDIFRPSNRLPQRLSPVFLDLDFDKAFAENRVGAYERLLLDAIAGRLNLFVRSDEQEQAWRWVEPVLDAWARDDAVLGGPRPYAAGTWGPAAASALVARDGFAWAEEQ